MACLGVSTHQVWAAASRALLASKEVMLPGHFGCCRTDFKGAVNKPHTELC